MFKGLYDKDNKKSYALFKLGLSFILIVIITVLINGCARWPNGGGGDEKKLLIIRVDINENGKINTELGKYYIVFDTRKDATQPPSSDIEEWIDGYYYIKLDNMGFCFGEWGKTCQYSSIGEKGEKHFSINLDLDSLGNPEKIFMNIITVDNKDNTYDSMGNPSDLTIDTRITNFNKLVQDFTGGSEGGPDFDILKASLTLLKSQQEDGLAADGEGFSGEGVNPKINPDRFGGLTIIDTNLSTVKVSHYTDYTISNIKFIKVERTAVT